MIRLLTQQDHDVVQSYLGKDPLHNIYLIHGLQTRGLESNFVTFWGAFDDDRLEGVLFTDNDIKPRSGFLAGDDPRVLGRLGKFALESEIKQLAGKSTYIQPAIENLQSRVRIHVKHFHFSEVHPEQLVRRYDYPVRAATEDDIPSLVELYRNYEFSSKNRTDEKIEHEIRRTMDESGGYFLIEMEGRAVSAARIVPETDRAGMIGAGRTLPEFRGRGIYLSVQTACLEYLFTKRKIGVSLVKDTNASMIRVVNKQGGSFTAKWLIVRFREKPPLRRRILPARLRRWGLSIKDKVWGYLLNKPGQSTL